MSRKQGSADRHAGLTCSGDAAACRKQRGSRGIAWEAGGNTHEEREILNAPLQQACTQDAFLWKKDSTMRAHQTNAEATQTKSHGIASTATIKRCQGAPAAQPCSHGNDECIAECREDRCKALLAQFSPQRSNDRGFRAIFWERPNEDSTNNSNKSRNSKVNSRSSRLYLGLRLFRPLNSLFSSFRVFSVISFVVDDVRPQS